MRHHNKNKKFGRTKNQRKALLRSLALSLIAHGKIKTTEAKAKALRPFIEKLVTKGKEGDVSSRRLILARLGNVSEGRKLLDEISPQYISRNGGYTRIVKLPPRMSDGSKMAIIEFI